MTLKEVFLEDCIHAQLAAAAAERSANLHALKLGEVYLLAVGASLLTVHSGAC